MRNFLVSTSPSNLKSRKKLMSSSQKRGASLRNLFKSSNNNNGNNPSSPPDDHTASSSTGLSLSSNKHDGGIFDDNHPHNVSLSIFLEQNNNSSSSFGGISGDSADMFTSPTGTPKQRRGVRPGLGGGSSSLKSHRQHSRRDFAIALDDDDIKSVGTCRSGRSLMTTQTAPADFVPTLPGIGNGGRQRIISKAYCGSGTGRSRRDLSILIDDSEDDANSNSPRSVTASPSSTKQQALVYPKSAGASSTRRPRRDCAVFSVDSPASAGAISTGRGLRGVLGKLACPPPLSSPGAGHDQKPAPRKKLLHK
jgi:hypothetical protein